MFMRVVAVVVIDVVHGCVCVSVLFPPLRACCAVCVCACLFLLLLLFVCVRVFVCA